jgi:hypothetical protein
MQIASSASSNAMVNNEDALTRAAAVTVIGKDQRGPTGSSAGGAPSIVEQTGATDPVHPLPPG